jgi:hypothetical protein
MKLRMKNLENYQWKHLIQAFIYRRVSHVITLFQQENSELIL